MIHEFCSTDELKEIFWREIIPNIVEYALLTDEMLDYFKHENLFLDVLDENFSRTLKCNEPKAGKDFIVYKTTDLDDAGGRTAGDDEPLTTIAKKMYLGDFGWDMDIDDDTDGAGIRIKVDQRAPEPELEEDDSLDKVLSIVLTAALQLNAAKQYKQLPIDEMIELLQDENDLNEPENLKTLPRGLQKLMTNCKYFAASHNDFDVVQAAVTPRRTKRSTILDIPDVSMPSDASTSSDPQQASRTAMTPHTRNRSTLDVPDMNSGVFDPQHASSPMESSSSQNISPLTDVSNTPARKSLRSAAGPRSKPGQDRAHNSRMELWMQTMSKNKKRPRNSTSPTSPEPEPK